MTSLNQSFLDDLPAIDWDSEPSESEDEEKAERAISDCASGSCDEHPKETSNPTDVSSSFVADKHPCVHAKHCFTFDPKDPTDWLVLQYVHSAIFQDTRLCCVPPIPLCCFFALSRSELSILFTLCFLSLYFQLECICRVKLRVLKALAGPLRAGKYLTVSLSGLICAPLCWSWLLF